MTKQPRVTTKTPIGPDVDLDREDVRLRSGERLTSKVAEEIVEEVRRTSGRPSLSGEADPLAADRLPRPARSPRPRRRGCGSGG